MFERLFEVADNLNQIKTWGLSRKELRDYIEHLVHIHPDIQHFADDHLRTVLSNYHADHRHVRALSDQGDPHHLELWENWSRQVVRLVAARLRANAAIDIATIAIDDLAQEVLSDIWQALPTFRYESRFQTWIFTVVANRIARSFRTATTKKRSPAEGTQSLERIVGLDLVEHPAAPSTEDVAMENSLELLLQRILAEHPDARLQRVFHLWMYDDQPLRVIGDQLNLSVSRVHALLNNALTILRSEQRLKSWLH